MFHSYQRHPRRPFNTLWRICTCHTQQGRTESSHDMSALTSTVERDSVKFRVLMLGEVLPVIPKDDPYWRNMGDMMQPSARRTTAKPNCLQLVCNPNNDTTSLLATTDPVFKPFLRVNMSKLLVSSAEPGKMAAKSVWIQDPKNGCTVT